MTSVLTMPRLGETMEEGTLVSWMVEPGQPFSRGDSIVEVETDKTIVEFPALGDGVLVETLAEVGQVIAVGEPIARVDVGDGPDWTDTGDEVDASAGGEAEAAQTSVEHTQLEDTGVETADADGRLRATPLARRIALQKGVDLTNLSGTGRRGRIERRDVEAAGQNADSDMQFAHGIAYLEKGPAHGAPILFLHGFAGDHTVWAAVQSQLARADRRTIAVDLPSHGAATANAAAGGGLAPPVLALADDLLGSDPLHLVAHSMGAVAAVALAQARPVASVTLIAPVGLGSVIDADFVRGLAAPKSVEDVATLLSRMTNGPVGVSAAAIAELYAALSKGRLSPLAADLVGMSGQAVDLRADLADLASRMPVHMILGHRDRIIDWREALDVSPRIAVHHLPDVGHMPHWEALADVTQILIGLTEPA
ncbi:MAG: acetoin dehydrogenase dihydrolipoyllysine-residue acetyltransferase subunit [Pseudomonadota bacterium]